MNMNDDMRKSDVTMSLASARSRMAHGTTLILQTMSLGVLIAQIDTSVVNLAVKQIAANLNAGVTALQWVVDAYNLVYASLLLTAGTLADL
jgi:MFS transporter, DHA2 family, methylenomycin A resistance protein